MINYMKEIIMNRSKSLSYCSGSVMAAGAAHAEMSISGLTVGNISDAGGGQFKVSQLINIRSYSDH